MTIIRCPDPFFHGPVGALQFRDGVAETDDPGAIEFCRAAGYTIEDLPPDVAGTPLGSPRRRAQAAASVSPESA